jgi:quinol monooxygenase YgiN
MRFTQIIEFTTGRIDRFNTELDEWMARSEGQRVPHRAVLRRDRDDPDRYLLMVEFASHEQGMENSARPQTGEFAAFLAGLSDSALTFRNLDVLREEDL